jgi:alanine transaminase
MIPIPQYPLYSALVTLEGASECHYYLQESEGWQINLEELEN